MFEIMMRYLNRMFGAAPEGAEAAADQAPVQDRRAAGRNDRQRRAFRVHVKALAAAMEDRAGYEPKVETQRKAVALVREHLLGQGIEQPTPEEWIKGIMSFELVCPSCGGKGTVLLTMGPAPCFHCRETGVQTWDDRRRNRSYRQIQKAQKGRG
jgi:hypothetical protein